MCSTAQPGTTPKVDIFAKTILATPPNEQYYRQWIQHPGCQRMFMPVWNLYEMDLCREKCYPHISEADAHHMLNSVGFVPGSVFVEDPQEREFILRELRRAVDGLSFKRCALLFFL